MRFRYIGLLILVLFCISSCSAPSAKYAAKVNGVKIEEKMVESALSNFIENQKMTGIDVKEEDKDRLRELILEELVSAELLYQESKKAGLGDVSSDVETQFENIKNGFSSVEEFDRVLRERSITEKELKEDIRRGISITMFLNRNVYNDISITEEEKQAEYEKNKDGFDIPEQVRASHILVRVKPDASDEEKKEAKDRINELRKRIVAGEDFAEIAKENSDDGTARLGGDLGYFKRGDMVEPFEETAFSLEKDEISKVVETQFGYHIIKLLDKKEAHTMTYDDAKVGIERYLKDKRKREELKKFVQELRNKARIEVF